MSPIKKLKSICVVFVATTGITTRANADQFVAFDVAYEHSPKTSTYSHHWVMPSKRNPPNLVSPVDYTQGTAHFFLEVFTKPSDLPTMFHNCFGTRPHYSCQNYSPKYNTVGIYEWSEKVAKFSNFSQSDWSLGIVDKTSFIITNGKYGNVGIEDVGGPAETALYMPTKLRVVVTFVSAGAVYVPPKPTVPVKRRRANP